MDNVVRPEPHKGSDEKMLGPEPPERRPELIVLGPEPPQGGPLHFMPDHPNVVALLVGAQASQSTVAHFPHISGVILAGGQSRRMGHDKALLPLPDTSSHSDNLQQYPQMTFLQRQVALLTAYCQEVFLVVRDQDQAVEYAAHLRDNLAGSDMPTILTDRVAKSSVGRVSDGLVGRAPARGRPYNETNGYGDLSERVAESSVGRVAESSVGRAPARGRPYNETNGHGDLSERVAESSVGRVAESSVGRVAESSVGRAPARGRPYNETNGHGPLLGLYTGLSAMTTTHAVVVAVDMPFIRPALLSFLVEQPLTDAILVPVVDGVPQVLLAVYPRSILPLVEGRLREGRRDPRSLLEVAPVKTVSEEELRRVDPQLRSFVNVNTPEELERA